MLKRRATFKQLTCVFGPLWIFPFLATFGTFMIGRIFLFFGTIPLFLAGFLWMALASGKVKLSLIDTAIAGLVWMLSGILSIFSLFLIVLMWSSDI